MLSMCVGTAEQENYRHSNGMKVTDTNGEICAYVAWWSDNPLESAKREARLEVVGMANYNLAVKRQVRDADDNILWETELHPIRAKGLTPA